MISQKIACVRNTLQPKETVNLLGKLRQKNFHLELAYEITFLDLEYSGREIYMYSIMQQLEIKFIKERIDTCCPLIDLGMTSFLWLQAFIC